MVNYEIQYTGKFDMLTYFFGTNSDVVLSPDCITYFILKYNFDFQIRYLNFIFKFKNMLFRIRFFKYKAHLVIYLISKHLTKIPQWQAQCWCNRYQCWLLW